MQRWYRGKNCLTRKAEGLSGSMSGGDLIANGGVQEEGPMYRLRVERTLKVVKW